MASITGNKYSLMNGEFGSNTLCDYKLGKRVCNTMGTEKVRTDIHRGPINMLRSEQLPRVH
jgi:hypothetical protein